MPPYSELFSPSLVHVQGTLAVFGVAIILALLGAVVSGERRVSGADVFVGWGVSCFVFVLFGTVWTVPLSTIALGIVGVAAMGALSAYRQGRFTASSIADLPVLWRVLGITAPMLLLVSGAGPSQWDEFSQWLPNAYYLAEFDAFPGEGYVRDGSSAYPAYPYALPLVTYAASLFVEGIVEHAGAYFNLVTLIALVPLYLGVVADGLGRDRAWLKQWQIAAFGFLGVTVLSTTFVQKLLLTHYADAPSSAVLAVIGILLWRLLNAAADASDDARRKGWAIAGQVGAVGAALLFLKQTNLMLFVFLIGGAMLVAMRDPDIRVRRFLPYLVAVILPGAVLVVLWKVHAMTYLAGGDFSFRPPEKWHLSVAGDVFLRMLEVASKKGPYFIMMIALTGAALYWLARPSGKFGRFAVLAASVFVAYNLSLWMLYITAFGDRDALRVASYWRYNSQLGLLGATAAALGVAVWWRGKENAASWAKMLPRYLGIGALILAIALPFVFAEKLRFDLRPQKLHFRAVSAEIAKTLPEDSRVFVLDSLGQGETRMIAQFELVVVNGRGRGLRVVGGSSLYDPLLKPEAAVDLVARVKPSHMLVNFPRPVLAEAFNVTLPEKAISLLAVNSAGVWRVEKHWPYPGYDAPHLLPD